MHLRSNTLLIRRGLAGLALAAGTAVAAVLFNLPDSHGQSTMPADATTRPATVISPDAQPLLAQLTRAYQQLHSLQLVGTIAIDVDAGGQKKLDHAELTGSFTAPDDFRHELKDQDTVISNGSKLYTYLNARNSYLQFDAPKSRQDGVPPQVGEVLMDQDPSLLLAVSPDAADVLGEGASAITKIADTMVGTVSCPTLRIDADGQQTRVMIDPATGLVREVVHDLSNSLKAQQVPDVKSATVTVQYTSIVANPSAGVAAPVTTTDYDWTPPPDAKPMDQTPTTSPADGGDAQEEPALQLVGKPAADFTLTGIDGKPFKLADEKGKVVILDFWATWCPPCRAGLPILNKIATDRPNDVKIYAVNMQEDAPTVKGFLDQNHLLLPVLMDTDGKTAEAYKVVGIPETVVIGKDGVIRKVLVGLEDDEAGVLNAAIDAANK